VKQRVTYFGFLLRFLGVPIVALSVVAFLDWRRGRRIPDRLRAFPFAAAVALHVVIALLYTTPWDNYLVATGVWTYDPALVAGVTIGWVPIEEYTFFIVQTILAGLWLLFLLRRLPLDVSPVPLLPRWRWGPVVALAPIWAATTGFLLLGWRPGTYLGLELGWALLPIMLQLGFGGDILRRYGRLVLLSTLGMTAYLSAADFIAIKSGTWNINTGQSLNALIGGVLPIEEVVFFLLTNTLITFGMVLLISQEGISRGRRFLDHQPGVRDSSA
jgi:lycopene cyclase domain-containing protein